MGRRIPTPAPTPGIRTNGGRAGSRDCAANSAHTSLRELGTLYERPSAAKEAFDSLVRAHGLERAAAMLRERPAELGTLRASIARDTSRLEALTQAATLVGQEATVARGSVSAAKGQGLETAPISEPTAAERASAREEIERLAKRERTLGHELGHLPQLRELEYRIGKKRVAVNPCVS